MRYTSIEKKFDELTPEWIVSTNRIIFELGDAMGKAVKWDLGVTFRDCIVKKASVKNVDGHEVWYDIDAKVGIPDFVVMNEQQYKIYQSMIERAKNGLNYLNPFKQLGCLSGWYIEVFGDYYHSGKYVRGKSKEEHEEEVIKAYRSAGAEVLILWENDIHNRWDEYCLPKLNNFLSDVFKNRKIPEWTIGSHSINENMLSVWKSLDDPEYWRDLDEDSKNDVVNKLNSIYDHIDFPKPDLYMAKYDFSRFMKWSSGTIKNPTRFGNDCCRHFIGSMNHAKVKDFSSSYELWNNRQMREEVIRWQLSNENGIHHASRFLAALHYKNRFRTVTNLSPGKVVFWIRKYGNIKPGGIFFDACAGWGGRMLAAHALGMKYIGIDANKKLVEELNKMAEILKIDAKVVYGSSADSELYKELLGDKKIDLAFTSPPYYDKEIYSEDSLQSIIVNNTESLWYQNFIIPTVNNLLIHLNDYGVILMNVFREFNVELVKQSISAIVDDFDISIEHARSLAKERMIKIQNGIIHREVESVDYVVCKVCNRRFKRLMAHLTREHKMSRELYLKQYPGSMLICKNDSERVKEENKRKQHSKYKQRTVYCCPDGKIVKKRDAWERAWRVVGKEPASETIIDASKIVIDPFEGKIENIDYVVCEKCGFRGKNIKRHLIREHGIEYFQKYKGLIQCSSTCNLISHSSLDMWKNKK